MKSAATFTATRKLVATLTSLALLLGACSGSESAPSETDETVVSLTIVEPDVYGETFSAIVNLTDVGPDPAILFLPAGRYIRLSIRSRSSQEHHYRVVGLVPGQLRWLVQPQYTLFQLEQMTPEQQEAVGFDPNESIENHTEHHLTATLSPTRERSPEGIKPLGTEVHAWASPFTSDIVHFYALSVGEFEVVDPLHPGETATVIVFQSD